MWATIGAAVESGWGSTIRLVVVVIVLGAVVVAIVLASAGSEVIGISQSLRTAARWALALV